MLQISTAIVTDFCPVRQKYTAYLGATGPLHERRQLDNLPAVHLEEGKLPLEKRSHWGRTGQLCLVTVRYALDRSGKPEVISWELHHPLPSN